MRHGAGSDDGAPSGPRPLPGARTARVGSCAKEVAPTVSAIGAHRGKPDPDGCLVRFDSQCPRREKTHAAGFCTNEHGDNCCWVLFNGVGLRRFRLVLGLRRLMGVGFSGRRMPPQWRDPVSRSILCAMSPLGSGSAFPGSADVCSKLSTDLGAIPAPFRVRVRMPASGRVGLIFRVPMLGRGFVVASIVLRRIVA